jgi:predicted AAA+ superfamily ATPase
MEAQYILKLQQQSDLLKAHVSMAHQRFLMDEITWDWRCIGIRGARGVGKTTLLLQRLKTLDPQIKSVYLTLDDIHFGTFTLKDTLETFRLHGYTYFFLDEVHKYPDWSKEIKNIYDLYPEIYVIFTGSNVMELHNQAVDLSRRAVMYDLPGLSFREYLQLSKIAEIPAIKLEDLLKNHREIALPIISKIRPIQHLQEYWKDGYFPFFLENRPLAVVRIKQIIQLVLQLDISGASSQSQKLARLLQFIATSSPFKPNISNISRTLSLDRDTVMRYLEQLNMAQLIIALYGETETLSALQRPEKIYLQNNNFSFALAPGMPELGNLRETFFLNQVRVKNDVKYPSQSDFMINDQFLFEIGGPGKNSKQIAGLPNAYLALDEIETGLENRIPLWMFGLLY